MSLIFQTLKKLQQEQSDPSGVRTAKGRRPKNGRIGRLLGTPLAMWLFIGSIFVSGMVMLYGVNQLSSSHKQSREATYKASPATQPVTPEAVPKEPARPQETYLPPEPAVVAAPAVSPADTTVKSDAPVPDFAVASASPVESKQKITDTSGDAVPAADVEATGSALESSSLVQSDVAYTPALAPNASFPERTVSGNDVKMPAAIRIPDEDQQRLANLEKFQKAAKERVAIAQWVAELESAIGRLDEPEVNRLLRRLIEVKGEESHYLLNLKAYWHLKQEKYTEAETLLRRILESDPDHLEAGVNLAIVELKTGRKEAGLKRLKHLETLYPDNPVIAGMIRKLS